MQNKCMTAQVDEQMNDCEGELEERRRNACKSPQALKQAIFINQELCLRDIQKRGRLLGLILTSKGVQEVRTH